jgi:surface-anchored protein
MPFHLLFKFCAAAGLVLSVQGQGLPPGRVVLTNEHVDLRITYTPGASNELGLVVRNSDLGQSLPADGVALVALEAARLELPPGFEVFGNAGDLLWILPQSQDPALLYMGFSAEGLPTGVFEPRFDIRLVQLDGPGHFYVWQADSFGGIDVRMNSRDGLGPDDRVRPLLGGHDHFNWGFTTNGLYTATFRVSARRVSSTNELVSPDIPVLFAVLPLPVGPPEDLVLTVPVRRPGTAAYDVTVRGAVAGRTYVVERSTDLQNWQPHATLVGAQPDQFPAAFLFPADGAGASFRVRPQP